MTPSHGLEVVAVIPHYNDSEQLPTTINDSLEDGYQHVYVLDDASPDKEAFEAAVEAYDPLDVTVVRGQDNRGAGSNRNRILEVEPIQAAAGKTLLHFMDADVSLTTSDNPQAIRDIFDDPTIGMAGGLFVGANGRQHALNYGGAFTAAAHVAGIMQLHAESLIDKGKTGQAVAFRQRYHALLKDWPDTLETPQARDVYWVIEANSMLPAAVSKAMGGYPNIRFHEVQGLAHELEAAGLRRRFDPRVAVHHPEEQQTLRHATDQASATIALIRKYGLNRFLWGPNSPQAGQNSNQASIEER